MLATWTAAFPYGAGPDEELDPVDEPTVSVSEDDPELLVSDALDELADSVARLRVVLRLWEAPVPMLAPVPTMPVPVGLGVMVVVALAELGGKTDGAAVTVADEPEDAAEEDELPPVMEKSPV